MLIIAGPSLMLLRYKRKMQKIYASLSLVLTKLMFMQVQILL